MHQVVLQGSFKYSENVTVPVRIIWREFFPGTGDEEDDFDIQGDFVGACYELQFGSTTEKEVYNSSGGYFKTIDEAKLQCVKLKLEVFWFKDASI